MAGISMRLALNPISCFDPPMLDWLFATGPMVPTEGLKRPLAAVSFLAAAPPPGVVAAGLVEVDEVDLLDEVRLFADFFVIILLILPQSVGRLASE